MGAGMKVTSYIFICDHEDDNGVLCGVRSKEYAPNKLQPRKLIWAKAHAGYDGWRFISTHQEPETKMLCPKHAGVLATQEINSDPQEAEKLERAREQARERKWVSRNTLFQEPPD